MAVLPHRPRTPVAPLLGAAASLALLLRAGRQTPRFLLLLMALWVLSPFALLVAARAVAARRSTPVRAALDDVAGLLAVASPAVYAAAVFVPLGARPTPAFVMVPPISWLLVAAAVWLGARQTAGDRDG